jgi:hypothetical protein
LDRIGDNPVVLVSLADVLDYMAYLCIEYIPHSFTKSSSPDESSNYKLSPKTFNNHWVTFKSSSVGHGQGSFTRQPLLKRGIVKASFPQLWHGKGDRAYSGLLIFDLNLLVNSFRFSVGSNSPACKYLFLSCRMALLPKFLVISGSAPNPCCFNVLARFSG